MINEFDKDSIKSLYKSSNNKSFVPFIPVKCFNGKNDMDEIMGNNSGVILH